MKKNLKELLQASDPVRDQPHAPADKRELSRKAVLAAASNDASVARTRSRVTATVAILAVIAAGLIGVRIWPAFVVDLQAAVRFEVRLAEDHPAPGLREAKISDAARSVFLYSRPIVTNSDIASARVIPGQTVGQFDIAITFNAAGAEKMRTATEGHVGRPVAILIDDQVVLAPVLRAAITSSAVITGNYARAEAERIVNGIGKR